MVSTNSGASALDILKTAAPIDLMVLDLSMPKPDGFEVLKAVRSKWPGLRILVISGWMDGALLKSAKILGATFALGKTDAPNPQNSKILFFARNCEKHGNSLTLR